jgi:hypothetical protein
MVKKFEIWNLKMDLIIPAKLMKNENIPKSENPTRRPKSEIY